MATYRYRALKLDGSAVAGTLPAESERAALSSLDRLGLFPLELRPEQNGNGRARPEPAAAGEPAPAPPPGPGLLGRGRLGRDTVARYARQLADLTEAGVPILKALDAIGEGGGQGEGVEWGARESRDDVRARTALREVRREVSQGAALADALARHPQLFDRVAVSVVRAGEAGGFLPAALRRVATFAEREQALARKVKGALTYPAVLALLSAGAIVFLLTWVVPRFAVIYEDMGEALPLPTRILLVAAALLTTYFYVPLGLLTAAAAGVVRLVRTEEGRARLDAWALRVPLLRGVIAQTSIARFARTLGTLLSSGVPILQGLEIAREAAGNRLFVARLTGAVAPVREGASVAGTLRATRLFPPQVVEVIEVGQETGTLGEVLERIGERADEEVDHALRALVAVLEPLLVVCVAGFVFFVVLAALLPVFTLNTLIK